MTADYVLDEDYPAPAVSSPDDVLRSTDTAVGIFHAVGASAMRTDDDVVDTSYGSAP